MLLLEQAFWFVVFLCWGSFLNVVGHRIVLRNPHFCSRSRCPQCKKVIAWYDLFPLISFLLLGGKCRQCHAPISFLYPTVELLTACFFTLLINTMPLVYVPAYLFFFSALIVTVRSDAEYMLISRWTTLALIPIGIVCSFFGYIPISLVDSIIGACIGYFFLYGIAVIFEKITGQQGLGQGDLDLLAYIGSFCGVIGCWATVLLGSTTGSIVGIAYLLTTNQSGMVRIPFGPFLAIGAMVFVVGQQFFISFLIG